MATVRVREGALEAVLRGWQARREIVRRADRVVGLARINCPVDTGYLRSSIRRSEPMPSGRLRLTCTIRADARYAMAVHEGRQSVHSPRSWRVRGPGARRFLTNALSAAGGDVSRSSSR